MKHVGMRDSVFDHRQTSMAMPELLPTSGTLFKFYTDILNNLGRSEKVNHVPSLLPRVDVPL